MTYSKCVIYSNCVIKSTPYVHAVNTELSKYWMPWKVFSVVFASILYSIHYPRKYKIVIFKLNIGRKSIPSLTVNHPLPFTAFLIAASRSSLPNGFLSFSPNVCHDHFLWCFSSVSLTVSNPSEPFKIHSDFTIISVPTWISSLGATQAQKIL